MNEEKLKAELAHLREVNKRLRHLLDCARVYVPHTPHPHCLSKDIEAALRAHQESEGTP